MMKEIDWSKAPEGATHFGSLDESKPDSWCRKDSLGRWRYWIGEQSGWSLGIADTHIDSTFEKQLIPRTSSPAWSGEGLPPVGTVCEVMNKTLDNPDWERCTILFMGKFKAVYESESCHERVADVSENWMISFRPIRTPEQIAAEERGKAVRELKAVAFDRFRSVPSGGDAIDAICEALYDAGYRKTGEGK